MRFNSFIEEAINSQIEDRESYAEDIRRIAGVVTINDKDQSTQVQTNFKEVVDSFAFMHAEIEKKLVKIAYLVEN